MTRVPFSGFGPVSETIEEDGALGSAHDLQGGKSVFLLQTGKSIVIKIRPEIAFHDKRLIARQECFDGMIQDMITGHTKLFRPRTIFYAEGIEQRFFYNIPAEKRQTEFRCDFFTERCFPRAGWPGYD